MAVNSNNSEHIFIQSTLYWTLNVYYTYYKDSTENEHSCVINQNIKAYIKNCKLRIINSERKTP